MPDHVGQLIRVLAPVMRNTGNTAVCDVRPRGDVVDLAHDRVFGGDNDGGDRGADRSVAAVSMNRLQHDWRIGQDQLSRLGEKLYNRVELTVIDCRGVTVHQVADPDPVGCAEHHVGIDKRCAQADSSSLARSISVIGGMASTSLSAP